MQFCLVLSLVSIVPTSSWSWMFNLLFICLNTLFFGLRLWKKATPPSIDSEAMCFTCSLMVFSSVVWTGFPLFSNDFSRLWSRLWLASIEWLRALMWFSIGWSTLTGPLLLYRTLGSFSRCLVLMYLAVCPVWNLFVFFAFSSSKFPGSYMFCMDTGLTISARPFLTDIALLEVSALDL